MEAASDSASGASGGRTPVAESRIAHTVRVVELEVPARGQGYAADDLRWPPHHSGHRGRRQADTTRGGCDAVSDTADAMAGAVLEENVEGHLPAACSRRTTSGSALLRARMGATQSQRRAHRGSETRARSQQASTEGAAWIGSRAMTLADLADTRAAAMGLNSSQQVHLLRNGHLAYTVCRCA